jgi:pimeloyl-ACP methyl ester carboxylesterase
MTRLARDHHRSYFAPVSELVDSECFNREKSRMTRSYEELSSRVKVGLDELSVVWTISNTRENGPRRIALLLHGGPEGSKDGPEQVYRNLAARLSTVGIDTVRFDFRGQGESSGDYIDMTMARQREDANTVVREIRNRGYERIGIVGESFGATCALGIYDERFTALVLLWPAIYLLDVCFAPFFDPPFDVELSEKGYIQVGSDRVGSDFLEEVKEVNDLEEQVKQVTVPTLLIHGSEDSEVPARQSERAYALLPHPKELVIVPGADHCLRRSHEQTIVLEKTTNWLNQYI